MENNIIEISSLTKKYNSFTAVDNLDLNIKRGEVFGLLGPNGAGKSTTILMLMGLTEPDSGTINVLGIDPVRYPVEVKKIVGYLPEDVGFYDNLTGLENLIYTSMLNRLTKSEAHARALEMLGKVGLIDEMEKKAGKYSRGMRQRLGLADAMIKKPRIIIMDEPTLGIDPAGIREFLDLIVRLSREEGLTVIFSSHHLHHVQQVCDRVGIFVKGKLLALGNIDQLAQQLFASNGTSIEVRLNVNPGAIRTSDDPTQRVIDSLTKLRGVENVLADSNIIKIKCDRNITSDIVRSIIDSGAELSYLNKKEYGLDDIYHKYFEGGKLNE